MPNIQLSSREAIKVWIEQDTERILGFTPENAKFLGAAGIRAKSYTLLHASEIERYIKKYRVQQEEDAYQATILQMQRESRFRKALASSIRDRNQHVNQFNRDLNNTLIRLMDERYDQIMKAKLRPVVHGFNEAYDASTGVEEFSTDSAYYKRSSGIDHVGGHRGQE